MSSNPRVTVTLPQDDEQMLELLAVEQGDTLAGLCRRVLVAYARRKNAEKRVAANSSESQRIAATRTRRKQSA